MRAILKIIRSWFLADGRLRPIWRLAIFLILSPYLEAFGGLWLSQGGANEALIELGGGIALLIVSLLLVVVLDRRPLASFGLPVDRWAARDFMLGLFITAVQLGLIFGIEWAAGWTRPLGFAWNADLFRAMLIGWIGTSLLEELLTRGYAFQSLLAFGGRKWGAILALLGTSVGFSMLHGANPHMGILPFLSLIIAGLEYGVAYLVTGRLWMPLAMHFAWNLIESTLLGFPVSGMELPSLMTLERGGPALFTGGLFGPEGGLLAPLFSLIDLGFLFWLSRRGFWRPEPHRLFEESADA